MRYRFSTLTTPLDDIFEKRLLMLLPFYIFSQENRFPEYNNNEQKLTELKAEYQEILERLDELEQQGVSETKKADGT